MYYNSQANYLLGNRAENKILNDASDTLRGTL